MSRVGIFCIALVLTVMSASILAAQEQESADDKATDESAVRVRYDNGFVFQTRDQRFLLNLRAGLQLRYTFMDYDPMVVGNETDYYDPENSYLNCVVDRRTGNPVSLCLIYLFLARRLRLPIAGVGLPAASMQS